MTIDRIAPEQSMKGTIDELEKKLLMLRDSLSSWSANKPYEKFIMWKISIFVILSYSTRVSKFVCLKNSFMFVESGYV